MKTGNIWKINKIEDSFDIVGRGTVFVIVPFDNGIDFEGELPFKPRDLLIYENETYSINGIESFARAIHYPQEKFGFVVRKIENGN